VAADQPFPDVAAQGCRHQVLDGARALVKQIGSSLNDIFRVELGEWRWTMNAVRDTWTHGQIVPSEPVDWPEGSELLVEQVPATEKIGLDESEWRDDPESIANWLAWVDTIEPLELTGAERAEMERYREQHRRFNIEAVRRQMDLGEAS
jgi:hypothetical protein